MNVATLKMRSVTQAEAQQWLDKTKRQRQLNKRTAQRYAIDMAAGHWVAGVAPAIILDIDGGVLDGMHRLTALLLLPAGSTLQTYVTTALATDHIEVIDTGRPRSLIDTLTVMGYEYPKHLSALVNVANYLGLNDRTLARVGRRGQIKWIDNNPNAIPAARYAHSKEKGSKGAIRIPIGVLGAMWDMASYGEGSAAWEEFVEMLQSGRGLGQFDIVRRLTNLIRDAKNPKTRVVLTPDAVSLLIARTYLAWLRDEEPQKLYARRNFLEELPGFGGWYQANWPDKA